MNYLRERQEIFTGMVEDKIQDEMRELEEKKSEEALLPVQKKFDLWRYQNERDEARILQRFGSSRWMKMETDSQDLLSVQSCRSSAVDHVEEISLESSRICQDVQVVMSEIAGKEMRGSGGDAWSLESGRKNGDAGNQSGFRLKASSFAAVGCLAFHVCFPRSLPH